MDLERLFFTRANIENVGELLVIIHRCMNEVNYKDYAPHEFKKYLANFTADWLIDIINTRHYYEVRYQGKIIACGGVSRDYSQEKQSYFTAEKDEWCLNSNLIEIPSSKSSHEFYYKCGYKYRNNPPIFSEIDGSTIMYKEVTPQD